MATTATSNIHYIDANDLPYDLDVSPRSSLYSVSTVSTWASSQRRPDLTTTTAPPPALPASSESSSPVPSLRLLFSQLNRRARYTVLAPAMASSVVAGCIAPFMTYVVGLCFNYFAQFPLSDPTEADKHRLATHVGALCGALVALAGASFILSSAMSYLWVCVGEHSVRAFRTLVHRHVMAKHAAWFDKKAANETGAAGLTSHFTKETDQVRAAASLAAGRLLQYITTVITCLIVAFYQSYALTFVILASLPLLIVAQIIAQVVSGPILQRERAFDAKAASIVDRAVAAIATVKAFNAAPFEIALLSAVLRDMQSAVTKFASAIGFSSGVSQFVAMMMFVQGFWYGSKLVRDGSLSPGSVMAVFWACLIASSNLQMCIPQLVELTKGTHAAAALLALITDAPDNESSDNLPPLRRGMPLVMRKIAYRPPPHRSVELSLSGVHFAYPARPEQPVLRGVDLFFPGGELTFVVGASGSGKSTIAQLLQGAYAPQQGTVALDDQDWRYVDRSAWAARAIACVSQGTSGVVVDGTVRENVCLGVGREVTEDEIREACTAALMNSFLADLPHGLDTRLGEGGTELSGGQRQRLAIARARLRNPPVLILDEPTSALDPTSRVLVFEAIKLWPRPKTTIVITHDLSHIGADDFVYVMHEGRVSQCGYRADLEADAHGEFVRVLGEDAKGVHQQQEMKGAQQEAAEVEVVAKEEGGGEDEKGTAEEEEKEEIVEVERMSRPPQLHLNIETRAPLDWMIDAVAGIVNPTPSTPVTPKKRQFDEDVELAEGRTLRRTSSERTTRKTSLPYDTEQHQEFQQQRERLPSIDCPPTPAPAYSVYPPTPAYRYSPPIEWKRSPAAPRSKPSRKRWTMEGIAEERIAVSVLSDRTPSAAGFRSAAATTHGFRALLRDIYPTLTHKPAIAFGLLLSILSGACTPIFSYMLSHLMYQVSIGAQDVARINVLGATVLAITVADGLLLGSKYAVMETLASAWVNNLRRMAFAKLLVQDKRWFDRSGHGPAEMARVIVKDGDDARSLLATVASQACVVIAMLTVGLVWAMVNGWQLTLAGLAIAPIFAISMSLQARKVASYDRQNKKAREAVDKEYYNAVQNIRGIRAMGLDAAFQQRFDTAVNSAFCIARQGAFYAGCTYGVASGLIYLAEAMLFGVAAVLMAHGQISYLKMVETLNLVVFSVTIASQIMSFTERIAKSLHATRDLNEVIKLPVNTEESRGVLRPELVGKVRFNGVDFAYPECPDAPVLRNVNLEIADGECVAIVGASGSGKTTLATLLQRLYEPTLGNISIGFNDLAKTEVHHLRKHVSVVSQNPHLFDASVAQNIAYGSQDLSLADIQRAAMAANVHDFIMSLPKGYDTLLGADATALISGGQAQRLQI
ncbi:P-loop containing nucleoside triphosphate hydrolase protein, partial [Fistulina hepatica ATCC 64428]